MDRYEDLKSPLGRMSPWFKGRDRTTGELVTIHRIRLAKPDDDPNRSDASYEDSRTLGSVQRELSILSKLRGHDNIIELKDEFIDEVGGIRRPKGRQYIVYGFVRHSLMGYMNQYMYKRMLRPSVVKSYLYQCCRGLAHCHSEGVIHAALQPYNLVLSDDLGRLKIAGFDRGARFVETLPFDATSSSDDRLESNPYEKPWDKSPEQLLGAGSYGPSVDVWSMGTIFARMVTKKPLFPGDSEIDQLFQIFRQRGTPTEETWPGVSGLRDYNANFPHWNERPFAKEIRDNLEDDGLHLLEKCLTVNPADRVTAAEALDHPYFRDVDTKVA